MQGETGLNVTAVFKDASAVVESVGSIVQELAVYERALLTQVSEAERETQELLARARNEASSILIEAEQRTAEEIRRMRAETEQQARERAREIVAETERLIMTCRAELEARIAEFVNQAIQWILPENRGVAS